MNNRLNLSRPWLEYAKQANRQSPEGVYHCTDIIRPVQQAVLLRRHGAHLRPDPADLVWSLVGTGVHLALSRTPVPNMLCEQPFSLTLGHATVLCTPDTIVLRPQGAQLRDYKAVSVWSLKRNPEDKIRWEWQAQLSVNRFIVEETGLKVTETWIDRLFYDWKAFEAYEHGYPKAPILETEVTPWDLVSTEQFIVARVEQIEAALADPTLTPPCAAEERWQRPTQWAVTKPCERRAIRVFDSEREAGDFATTKLAAGKSVVVQKREGADRRCEEYCPVKEFCQQWKFSNKEAKK